MTLILLPCVSKADSVEAVQTYVQDSSAKRPLSDRNLQEREQIKEKEKKLSEPMYSSQTEDVIVPAEIKPDSAVTGNNVKKAKPAGKTPKGKTKSRKDNKNSAGSQQSGQNQPQTSALPAGEDKSVLESGIMLYNAGNFSAAIEKLKQMKEKSPQSVYTDLANQWLARSYMKSGNYKEAISSLELIKPESGEFPAALYLEGQIYFASKDYTSASEKFHRVASQFPTHDLADDALIHLSKTNLIAGNGNLAVENLLNVIKNYQGKEMIDDAYYNLAKVYEKDRMLRDLEQARNLYRKFIEKSNAGEQFFANSPLRSRVEKDLSEIEKRFFSGGR